MDVIASKERIEFDGNVTFEQLLVEAREKFWKLDDVLAKDASLEFSQPLLPESITSFADARFLSENDALLLNQITGKSYVNLFYFVEEYIIRDIERMEKSAAEASAEKDALAGFAAEEIKHQALFKRFMDAFDRGFPIQTDVLDFADDIADAIMGNSHLAVLLTTLHLEVITQEHYLRAIEPSENVEPQMVSILRHHWIDEARHAAVDYLEIQRMVANLSTSERATGVSEYLGILEAFFELLSMQASHDVAALAAVLGERLEAADHRRLQFIQHQCYSRLFLELGLRHPALRRVIEDFMPGSASRLDFLADKFRLA